MADPPAPIVPPSPPARPVPAPPGPAAPSPAPPGPAAGGRLDHLGPRSLRAHAARGTLINGAFLAALTVSGFLKGFAVATFLTPEQFGIWGILAVGLGSLALLKQAGISDKYIQQDDDDQELAFQRAFTLEAIFNAGLALIMAAAVPGFALLYGQPELLAPGLVAVAVLPALTLQSPLWILYRQMRFGRQRLLQAVDPLTTLVATVALAALGAGYWSLVLGLVAGSWAAALAALASCPYRLRWAYDRGTAREYVRFSGPLVVWGLSAIVLMQASIYVGELAVGLAGVGAIALASSISQLTDRVDAIITQTLYPAVCAVADRTELLFESFVKSNRLALMWAMPFGFGLALFAPDLVRLVLGERWEPATILLQAFGAIAAVGHLGFNWTAYMRARGTTRPLAAYGVVATTVFLAAGAPLTLTLGLPGFALGLLVMTVAGLAVRGLYLRRLFAGFHLGRHAARALAPSLPAPAVVGLLRALEGGGQRSPALVALEVTLFLAITVAATVALERPLLREAAGYLRAGTLRPARA